MNSIILLCDFDLLLPLSLSPTSDGSAAAIVCSEDFVRRHNLQSKAVEIVAMTMRTDFPSTFKEKSGMKLVSRKYFKCQTFNSCLVNINSYLFCLCVDKIPDTHKPL